MQGRGNPLSGADICMIIGPGFLIEQLLLIYLIHKRKIALREQSSLLGKSLFLYLDSLVL